MGCPDNADFTCGYFLSSPMTTVSGLKWRACLMSSSSLDWAVSTSVLNMDGWASITSSACLPIEPVDPKRAMRFLGVAFDMVHVIQYTFPVRRPVCGHC